MLNIRYIPCASLPRGVFAMFTKTSLIISSFISLNYLSSWVCGLWVDEVTKKILCFKAKSANLKKTRWIKIKHQFDHTLTQTDLSRIQSWLKQTLQGSNPDSNRPYKDHTLTQTDLTRIQPWLKQTLQGSYPDSIRPYKDHTLTQTDLTRIIPWLKQTLNKKLKYWNR